MTRRDDPVPRNSAILVSGFDPADEGRGGVFAWDGWALVRVDDRYTTGLHMSAGTLVRCLWNTGDGRAGLAVTARGAASRSFWVDGVGNPHDVMLDGDLVAVVATEQNQIVWFDLHGRRVRAWQPPGEGDSWHLNSLVTHAGRLLVCAFGRFARRKEWDLLGRPATGCVVDVATGSVVIDGLRAPHTPRRVAGGWLVCNSADGELVEVTDGGTRRVLATFHGWPRGMVVTPSAVFVGVSPARRDLASRAATSHVVALDRRTWEVTGEVAVPAREVYDLVAVPAGVVATLAAEFADGQGRVESYVGYQAAAGGPASGRSR
jgi:acetolactate synthase-1/2/3 large subunit